MSNLVLEEKTSKASMDDHRSALDSALKEQFPGGMLKSQWQGDVLELSGPGAKGTIVLQGDQLVGKATLSPPASLMARMIEEKITTVLKKAVS
ncbi:MAG: polyhydroxyalkanoic acid system family protein [Deltaproteobacteria bacterium]|nr:polyhydroxyalkanoic acid system family protein [Deltaproteobacteria bacterium]